jgi:hypothetical protein
VIGMTVRGDETHRHIAVRRTLDPARGKYPAGNNRSTAPASYADDIALCQSPSCSHETLKYQRAPQPQR